MTKNNEIAGRAYNIAFGVLQGLALGLNADISDLMGEEAARSKDSTAPNLEDQFAAGVHVQGYPLAGEHSQVFGAQEMHASDFYDNRTGYASTFAIPEAELQGNSFVGSIGARGAPLSDYSRFDPMFGNPFMTSYDEGNPVTSGENLFSMNAFMPGFRNEQPPS